MGKDVSVDESITFKELLINLMDMNEEGFDDYLGTYKVSIKMREKTLCPGLVTQVNTSKDGKFLILIYV